MKDKKITKTYLIELTMEKGKTTIRRRNDGFKMLELLGLLELAKTEIYEQMKGNMKPDVIKREVVK